MSFFPVTRGRRMSVGPEFRTTPTASERWSAPRNRGVHTWRRFDVMWFYMSLLNDRRRYYTTIWTTRPSVSDKQRRMHLHGKILSYDVEYNTAGSLYTTVVSGGRSNAAMVSRLSDASGCWEISYRRTSGPAIWVERRLSIPPRENPQ